MKSYKSYGYLALGLTLGAVALWLLSGDADNPEYLGPYLLVALSGFILSFPVSKVIAGEIPWYSPHAVVLASYFMMYVASPAVRMWIGPYSDYYRRDLSGAELSYALAACAVGVFFYLVGYRFGPKKAKLSRGLEWYFTDTPAVQSLFPWMTGLVIIIGLGAWAFAFATSGGVGAHLRDFGGSRQTLDAQAGGIVLHLGKFIWVGAALWMSRYGLRLSTFLVIAATSAPLLLYGSRSFIAMMLLGCFICWRFRFVDKVPKLVWAGMAAALIILMSGYVLLRQTGGNVQRAAQMYTQATSTTEGKVAAMTEAFAFIVPMAELLQETPDKVPYQYGRSFGTVFYVIPNMIWPNKQELFQPASRLYTEKLFPHRADKITITPSIMSEFFINFGWFGVVLCPLAIGWFIRWFEQVIMGHPHRKNQVAWIAFGAIVSINMLRVMKNGFGTIIYAFYFAVPLFIVYWPNIGLLFSPPPDGATFDDGEWGEGEFDEGYGYADEAFAREGEYAGQA